MTHEEHSGRFRKVRDGSYRELTMDEAALEAAFAAVWEALETERRGARIARGLAWARRQKDTRQKEPQS